jgi:hypothetical protein
LDTRQNVRILSSQIVAVSCVLGLAEKTRHSLKNALNKAKNALNKAKIALTKRFRLGLGRRRCAAQRAQLIDIN